MARFTGFPKETLGFLRDLELNNRRDWFDANKARYESLVREPALDFIATMGPELQKISSHFVAIPKKVGGSLMRVYRDTRFARDKTPYKTNIGIQFRHERGKDVHAPGYYVHIDNSGCFFGVGVWHPEPDARRQIRQRIVDQPALWRKARQSATFSRTFELGGDSLKRPPRGISDDHPPDSRPEAPGLYRRGQFRRQGHRVGGIHDAGKRHVPQGHPFHGLPVQCHECRLLVAEGSRPGDCHCTQGAGR